MEQHRIETGYLSSLGKYAAMVWVGAEVVFTEFGSTREEARAKAENRLRHAQ